MLFDIICISFLNTYQVGVGYLLFVVAVSFFDIGLQFIYRCMQIDQQVRLNQLLMDYIKQSLVKPELIIW